MCHSEANQKAGDEQAETEFFGRLALLGSSLSAQGREEFVALSAH
jgi:hypothetical protein